MKKKVILMFLFLSVLFVIGAFIGSLYGEEIFDYSNVIAIPILGICTMFSGSVLTGILPISLLIYRSNKRKVKALEEKGAVVVPVTLPNFASEKTVYDIIATAEISSNFNVTL